MLLSLNTLLFHEAQSFQGWRALPVEISSATLKKLRYIPYSLPGTKVDFFPFAPRPAICLGISVKCSKLTVPVTFISSYSKVLEEHRAPLAFLPFAPGCCSLVTFLFHVQRTLETFVRSPVSRFRSSEMKRGVKRSVKIFAESHTSWKCCTTSRRSLLTIDSYRGDNIERVIVRGCNNKYRTVNREFNRSSPGDRSIPDKTALSIAARMGDRCFRASRRVIDF